MSCIQALIYEWNGSGITTLPSCRRPAGGGGEIKLLDVGSYDVNGTYRPLFEAAPFRYTGLDMAAGPNVDIVPANTYAWHEIEDESFDAVISGQAFEHVEFFWITLGEMVRVLKRGGLMCIIAPRMSPLHRYPVDCWRFDTDGMIALARYANMKPLHASTDSAPMGAPSSWYSGDGDAMLVAQKPDDWRGMLDCTTYRFTVPDADGLSSGFIPKGGPKISSVSHIFHESTEADIQELVEKRERLRTEFGWVVSDSSFNDEVAIRYLSKTVVDIAARKAELSDLRRREAELERHGIKVPLIRKLKWYLKYVIYKRWLGRG